MKVALRIGKINPKTFLKIDTRTFRMGQSTRFFTFPVEVLQGAFTNIKAVCNDAINYAIFVRCNDYDESPDEAFDFFGITGNPDLSAKEGQELYDSFDNPPLVSVNKAIIFDFLKNSKTDFEISVFCCFCGLRSIIGTKAYVKTTNEFLLARMFGFRSIEELKKYNSESEYFQKHFSTTQKIRYQLTEKIIRNELEADWGLKYYSNQSRGFFASFQLDFERLVLIAEKSRKSFKQKERQATTKKVVEKVKKRLNE